MVVYKIVFRDPQPLLGQIAYSLLGSALGVFVAGALVLMHGPPSRRGFLIMLATATVISVGFQRRAFLNGFEDFNFWI